MGPRFVMLTQARLERERGRAVLKAAAPPVVAGDPIDQLLADAFNANNAILAYATAVARTDLPGLPRPEKFYEDFVDGFTGLKTRALLWQSSITPRMIEIPTTIVSFSSLFLLQIDQIDFAIDVLMDDPENKKVRDNLSSALTRLSQRVSLQQTTLQELRRDVNKYADSLTSDAAILRQAAADAVAAAGSARNQIEAITQDIGELRAEVSKYQVLVRASGIGAGLSVVVIVFGIFASFFSGPVGGVIIGLGLVGAGLGIVGIVLASNKVRELNARITARMSELTLESQQAATLVAITQTVNGLVTLSDRAGNGIDAIQGAWKALQDDVDTVIADLANAQRNLSRERLQALRDDIADAADDWQELVALAQKFSGILYTIERQVTPIPPPATPRAA